MVRGLQRGRGLRPPVRVALACLGQDLTVEERRRSGMDWRKKWFWLWTWGGGMRRKRSRLWRLERPHLPASKDMGTSASDIQKTKK